MHNDDSDQGPALPALHDRVVGRLSRGACRIHAQDPTWRAKPNTSITVIGPFHPTSPRRKGRKNPAPALLDERRAFQTQARTIADCCGRMMMANNPDALSLFKIAMAVLENKIWRLPTR